jgi:hypothetical protein
MKKVIIISFLCFCCLLVIKPGRIIQLSDIVNWCIESDLILTASIDKLDKIIYDTIISISGNSHHECISGREKYYIEIDSIIKGIYEFDTLTIYTPETCLSHNTYIKEGNRITSLMDFYDNSWFRLKEGDNRIIILKSKTYSYEVLYSMEINKSNFDFIDSVKIRSKDYLIIHPINEWK